MLKIKSIIHLIGNDDVGTMSLAENGCKYRVIGIQLGKAFGDKEGPWYLCQSLETDFYTYVHDTNDEHYVITSVEEPK